LAGGEKIAEYLKETFNLGICYEKHNKPLCLNGYCDSDYASANLNLVQCFFLETNWYHGEVKSKKGWHALRREQSILPWLKQLRRFFGYPGS